MDIVRAIPRVAGQIAGPVGQDSWGLLSGGCLANNYISACRAGFQKHGIYETFRLLAGVMFSVLIPWSQKWVFYVGETHFRGNGLESGLDLPRTVGATKICQEKLRATFAILSSFLSV